MTARWFLDREGWVFVGYRYLPWFAGLNLAWEFAQLPLYTIWVEADREEIAFAVFHCTLGDILIGMATFALALTFTRARKFATWRWSAIVKLLLLLGVGYTMFSEGLNTTLFRWSYSELMPTLKLADFDLGASPLLQWLFLPPLSLYLARGGGEIRQVAWRPIPPR